MTLVRWNLRTSRNGFQFIISAKALTGLEKLGCHHMRKRTTWDCLRGWCLWTSFNTMNTNLILTAGTPSSSYNNYIRTNMNSNNNTTKSTDVSCKLYVPWLTRETLSPRRGILIKAGILQMSNLRRRNNMINHINLS